MVYEQKDKSNRDGGHNDSTKVYLQVEKPSEDEAEIDLVNVAVNMSKRRKLYFYVFAVAACVGVIIGLIASVIGQFTGDASYAQAVLTLQYDGIESGLDPNGASFDINMVKSPVVIQDALSELGYDDVSAEDVRQNIQIEGIIPEDAVERITVIKEMSLEDISNYEKILDVSYFPSQYVITLTKYKGLSASKTREILNAVLDSYKSYFLDTYADTAVLTVTGNLLDYESYDYTEALDMIQSQVDIMQSYVTERRNQASDFRSSTTGLSFGDILTSLSTIEDIDLANLSSYVETFVLTKDKDRLVEYYNYNIKRYQRQIAEYQVNLNSVQEAIDNYVKDPVVIVSNQETTQEITQGNEYYDSLVQQKIDITSQIASINTNLNRTYDLLNLATGTKNANTQAEYDYADEKLADITSKLSSWAELIEETTDDYYSTTLFSNAVKISVPAQFVSVAGGLTGIIKTVGICVIAMVFIVLVIWCVDGLRLEIASMRRRSNRKNTK
jgi:hypothetical protein